MFCAHLYSVLNNSLAFIPHATFWCPYVSSIMYLNINFALIKLQFMMLITHLVLVANITSKTIHFDMLPTLHAAWPNCVAELIVFHDIIIAQSNNLYI